MQTAANCIKRLLMVLAVAVAAVGSPFLVVVLGSLVVDAGHAAVGRGSPLRPEEALTAVAALAALVMVGWFAIGALLEVLARVPGALGRVARRTSEAVTPALLRHVLAAVLGVGAVSAAAPGASAAAPGPSCVTAAPSAVGAPGPLPDPGFAPVPRSAPAELGEGVAQGRGAPAEPSGWVPEPPAVRAQPDVRVLAPARRPAAAHDRAAEVVVHRGDTLWTVAARHLGPGASDAEVADAWPRWYAANRSVIGDDPDLLRPGQRLRPPEEVRS